MLFEILVSSVLLAGDAADTLDLKITSATLREMREAFRLFAAYRGRRATRLPGGGLRLVDRVMAIDGRRGLALCTNGDGRRFTVETALVEPVAIGDVLLVHAGTAIASGAPA